MKAERNQKLITRKEYMENSSELHEQYYGQFVTSETISFVRNCIGIERLKKSTDKHFNDIIKHSNNGAGGWIWDNSPLNLTLARQAGEISEGYLGSMSTHTCVGKVAARMILNEGK